MNFFNKLLFYSLAFTLLNQFIYPSEAYGQIEEKVVQVSVTTEQLNKNDQEWFENKFVKTFVKAYTPLTFTIGPKDNPKQIGPNDTDAKKELLTQTAKEEFEEYVVNPKVGYQAFKVLVNGKPAGALLFRLKEKGKIIYLAKFFVCEEFSRNGVATYVLEKEMRTRFPEYKRYEVLTRYQNVAGSRLYKKLEYIEDKTGEIAKSYGYNPSRYKSLYKEFK